MVLAERLGQIYLPAEDKPWTVEYGDGTSAEVTSLETLHDAIDGKRPEEGDQAWMILISGLDCDADMTLGVGADRVPVRYSEGPLNSERHYTSRSERAEDVDVSEEHSYRFCGDYTYANAQELVPAEAAREAINEWLSTGQRPTNIDWTEL